jgi:hypothetical protein
MSYLNIQFSTLVILVSGVVHNVICLKVLAEITNVTFRSHGYIHPVFHGHTKDTISCSNAPQKEQK